MPSCCMHVQWKSPNPHLDPHIHTYTHTHGKEEAERWVVFCHVCIFAFSQNMYMGGKSLSIEPEVFCVKQPKVAGFTLKTSKFISVLRCNAIYNNNNDNNNIIITTVLASRTVCIIIDNML